MTSATTTAPAISSADLRGAMGRFATGVTVITSRGSDGPVGTTVSSVTSLSLDPPLLLVCLGRRSRTLAAIREHGAFAVNVLGAQHQSVSNAFAKSGNRAAWDDLSHSSGATGSPLLDGAHVALDCRLDRLSDGGDHEILIGRVLGLHHPDEDSEPLLVYGGKYHALAGPDAEARREREARAIAERDARARAEREAVECQLPTRDGRFRLLAHERHAGDLTAALVLGDPAAHPAPVVHAHTACLLGDVLGGLACDCGARLVAAQAEIQEAGAGVLLYTKRSSSDTFLCAAAGDPDLATGAGLLARLGVRRATLATPSADIGRRLADLADVQVVDPLHAPPATAALAARP